MITYETKQIPNKTLNEQQRAYNNANNTVNEQQHAYNHANNSQTNNNTQTNNTRQQPIINAQLILT